MKTWHRAKARMRCGAIHDCVIGAGDPYLLLRGTGWQKVRCRHHAGVPVPDDVDAPRPTSALPPYRQRRIELDDEMRAVTPMTSARALIKTLPSKVLLFDVKAAQAGDREE
jgi:hypothetical protein